MAANKIKTIPEKNIFSKKLIITCSILSFISCCIFLIIFISITKSVSNLPDPNANAIDAAVNDIKSSQTAIPPSITPSSSPTSTSTPVPNIIIGQNANVRSGPDLEYPVIRNLQKGEQYQVFSRSEGNTWISLDAANQMWIDITMVTLNVPLEQLPLAPTFTPTATMAPTATITPIPPIVIEDIYWNYQSMTKLQFSNYKNEIIGKMVRQEVIVGNVNEQGVVSLSGDWSPIIINFSEFGVAITGVPLEIANTLTGGDKYYLEARINGIIGDYNYYSNRETVVVLQFIKFGK
jgi:uncharacterized protein YraI